MSRYRTLVLPTDLEEYAPVVACCSDCGAIVGDQAAHDLHHTSDANRDRIHQLELERTMPSRLA